jgi:hypothetical protein
MAKVNLQTAQRQAFGAPFSPRDNDGDVARALLEGRLRLSPHDEWLLPKEPSWREDPFGDTNWQFQYHSLRWLDVLRRAHILGVDGAIERWESLAQAWLRTNPAIEGAFRWAWTDMSDALRAMTLCFALPYVQDRDPYLVALNEHVDWLADPRHLGRGNHALHQHAGLLVASRVLGDEERTQLALTRLDNYLASNYDEEGVNVEGSIGYHRLNLLWCQEALRRVTLEGLALPTNARRLDGAALQLAHASRPDGQLERIGDTDSGSATDIDSKYLTYVLSGGAQGEPPSELTKIYGAGYVFGRTGWGETERAFSQETFYSACFGSTSKIHGHADGGSVTFFANGKPWLVDSGKYSYQANEFRNYVISRRAHNVVDISSRRYRRNGTVDMVAWWQDDNFDSFVLQDDGYEGCEIKRRIIFSRSGEYLLVIDNVRADQSVAVETRWNLAPDVKPTRTRRGFNLEGRGGAASITWGGALPHLTSRSGSKEPMDGWISTAWKRAEPTFALTARKEGARLRMVSAICPRELGPDEGLSIRPVEGGLLCSVPARHGVEHILVGDTAVQAVDPEGTGLQQQGRRSRPTGSGGGSSARVREIEGLLARVRARAAASGGDRTAIESLRGELADYVVALNPQDPDHGMAACLSDLDLKPEVRRSRPGAVRPGLTSFEGSAPRTLLEDEEPLRIRHSHGVPSFASLGEKPELVSVDAGPLLIPTLVRRGSGPVLLVGFHGAVDRSKMAPPIFQRRRSHDGLSLPYMLISDPTLDLDSRLTLGWYLGGATQNIYPVIARMIEAATADLGLARALLIGSSGGGFAALQVASYMESADVLAFNPQTSIDKYFERLRERALRAVFGELPSDLDDQRSDLISRYVHVHGDVSATLVQNRGDVHHETFHRLPFVGSIGKSGAARVETVHVEWGKGHISPTAQQYQYHIQRLVDRFE